MFIWHMAFMKYRLRGCFGHVLFNQPAGEFGLSHAEISIAPRAPYAILDEEEVHERQQEVRRKRLSRLASARPMLCPSSTLVARLGACTCICHCVALRTCISTSSTRAARLGSR